MLSTASTQVLMFTWLALLTFGMLCAVYITFTRLDARVTAQRKYLALRIGKHANLLKMLRDRIEESGDARMLAQLAKVSAQLTELEDAYHSLLDSHKKLRSRIGMRELRERRKAEDHDNQESLDLQDEGQRAEYKKQLRQQAKKGGLL